METILIPLLMDNIEERREWLASIDPHGDWEFETDNDWEQHLPAMEALHEWLEAQQRGCDD